MGREKKWRHTAFKWLFFPLCSSWKSTFFPDFPRSILDCNGLRSTLAGTSLLLMTNYSRMVEEWCFLVHGEGQKKSNEQVLVLMQLVDCRNGYTTDGSASTIWRALHSEAPQAQSEPPPAVNYPTLMEGTKNGQCCHYFQEEKKIAFSFSFGLNFRNCLYTTCFVWLDASWVTFVCPVLSTWPLIAVSLMKSFAFSFWISYWIESARMLSQYCSQYASRALRCPQGQTQASKRITWHSCAALGPPKGTPEVWMPVLVISPNLVHTDSSPTASAPCPRRALCSSSTVVAVCDGPTNTEWREKRDGRISITEEDAEQPQHLHALHFQLARWLRADGSCYMY